MINFTHANDEGLSIIAGNLNMLFGELLDAIATAPQLGKPILEGHWQIAGRIPDFVIVKDTQMNVADASGGWASLRSDAHHSVGTLVMSVCPARAAPNEAKLALTRARVVCVRALAMPDMSALLPSPDAAAPPLCAQPRQPQAPRLPQSPDACGDPKSHQQPQQLQVPKAPPTACQSPAPLPASKEPAVAQAQAPSAPQLPTVALASSVPWVPAAAHALLAGPSAPAPAAVAPQPPPQPGASVAGHQAAMPVAAGHQAAMLAVRSHGFGSSSDSSHRKSGASGGSSAASERTELHTKRLHATSATFATSWYKAADGIPTLRTTKENETRPPGQGVSQLWSHPYVQSHDSRVNARNSQRLYCSARPAAVALLLARRQPLLEEAGGGQGASSEYMSRAEKADGLNSSPRATNTKGWYMTYLHQKVGGEAVVKGLPAVGGI
jgi:hypothetical protein